MRAEQVEDCSGYGYEERMRWRRATAAQGSHMGPMLLGRSHMAEK